MLAYLESSAVAKLVIDEAESPALKEALSDMAARLTSVVAEIEAHRALRRTAPNPERMEQLETALAGLELVELGVAVRHRAGTLDPPGLRSLDAIHLASALSLGDELGAFVCYDARLSAVATEHGLPVLAPS